ncbi:AAA family ATPase [Phormidium tenue]|jgi:hypothetical protein|uniref:AAA family ATPase n=1 Tax=Phormidium tenue FACHB-1050 TaxID=2692857 RepID=A0ABR8C797_9CYAN|nr:AAA family ATPase [Phormidium tenue]MBD2316598.1 AAA family ATPase [Phormidium tenue FACHB-1050]
MHLQRVQVPDFRVLKDVDITFEKDFNPRVFPLGSQNGGGKSTLLQLIFVLLHCSASHDRHFAIKNLLNNFTLREDEDKRVLAIIDVWDGIKSVTLEFFVCNDSYIKETLSFDYLNKFRGLIDNSVTASLSYLSKIKNRKSELLQCQNELQDFGQSLNENTISNYDESLYHFTQNLPIVLHGLNIGIPKFIYSDRSTLIQQLRKINSDIKEQIARLEQQIDELSFQEDSLIKKLKSKNIEYISTYFSQGNISREVLLCLVDNIPIDTARQFLYILSNKIFLAAPSTQVFLFLSQNARKSLFAKENDVYSKSLGEIKSNLTGLFTYDFLAVNYLINLFQSARDKDFKDVVDTGEYGDNYKKLSEELHSIMIEKKAYLKPNLDSSFNLSGVSFRDEKSNKSIELYPEDLSHGELKRLSIYCWLKYKNIEDSIVLMDEIDIALHPDWQYQIVSDLLEWSAKNQYILATHSYELCNALTPSHVKILEPKLTERSSD